MMQKQSPQFNALCTAFRFIATRTWHRVGNNHTTPIAIREDGITALNLQDLFSFQSQDFSVVDFSPYVESNETGADWEWWFMQPGHYFGAVVQAKTLTPAHEYDIGYVPQNGYPQICRLLDYAKQNDTVPMYCFYNRWKVAPARHWPCGSFVDREDLWGCALADGLTVWRLHRDGRYSLTDLHQHTMPWHCIACCPGYVSGGPEGPTTRALGISRELRARDPRNEEEADEQDDYADFPEPAIVEELPPRILELRKYLTTREAIDRSLVARLFGDTPPSKVVMIGNPGED